MKRAIFKKMAIPVLALTMVFGNSGAMFADETNEGQKHLEVSDIGYDSISGMYGDTIVAKKDGKYGIVKFDGTVLVPFEYDELSSFDSYDGVTVLQNTYTYAYNEESDQNAYYAFDKNGKKIYEVDYRGTEEHGTFRYYNGVFHQSTSSWVTGRYRNTFFNANGDLVLDVDSDSEGEMLKMGNVTTLSSWGYSLYYPYSSTDKLYLVGKDGVTELNNTLDGATPFFASKDYILCSKWVDRKVDCYVLDVKTGELTYFDTIDRNAGTKYNFIGGKYIYKISPDGEYSLMDIKGNPVTDKKYAYIEMQVGLKKYYLVSEGDKWFYIDLEGNEYGTELKDAGCFYDGKAIVMNADGQAYIVDEDFNSLTDSVAADGVISYNKNAYSITVNGKVYPVRVKEDISTEEETSQEETTSGSTEETTEPTTEPTTDASTEAATDATTGTSDASTEAATEAVSDASTTTANAAPNTGDTSVAWVFVVMLGISMGTLAVSRKAKKD